MTRTSRIPSTGGRVLEQLQFAVDHGDPLAPPGKRYSYADTNYILLGEIIERVDGHVAPHCRP